MAQSEYWYDSGIDYHFHLNYPRAIHCFEKALEVKPERELEINPYNLCILHNLGLSYNAQSKYQRAIECFKKMLKINPRDVSA